jgi:hypothetical protein
MKMEYLEKPFWNLCTIHKLVNVRTLHDISIVTKVKRRKLNVELKFHWKSYNDKYLSHQNFNMMLKKILYNVNKILMKSVKQEHLRLNDLVKYMASYKKEKERKQKEREMKVIEDPELLIGKSEIVKEDIPWEILDKSKEIPEPLVLGIYKSVVRQNYLLSKDIHIRETLSYLKELKHLQWNPSDYTEIKMIGSKEIWDTDHNIKKDFKDEFLLIKQEIIDIKKDIMKEGKVREKVNTFRKFLKENPENQKNLKLIFLIDHAENFLGNSISRRNLLQKKRIELLDCTY